MAFRYDPFERMNSMFDMMRQPMVDGPAPDSPWFGGHSADSYIHLEQTGDGYLVAADLPGFERDDLTVRFDNGMLTIRGEHHVDEERDHGTTSRHRNVHEQLTIPAEVQADDISATYRNGVLEVHLPTVADGTDNDNEIEIR